MEIAVNLDQRASAPLHRQLYDELRCAILAGRLKPGERVPSSRQLAHSLGISRATVTLSYEQLLSEGYLQAVIGSGTTVTKQLPDELLKTQPAPARNINSPQVTKKLAPRLSRYGRSLTDTVPFEPPEPELPINFKSGRPALTAFPLPQWRRLLLRHCRMGDAALLDYAAAAQGYEPLRIAIANYLGRARAVRCQPEQVIIVNGSQQALDLLTKVLLEPGDAVALENPGYLGARRNFLAQGARLLPVPVDDAGIVVAKLPRRAGRKVRMAYVTPSHQFPTGATLSLPRRLELLAWAAEMGALIIEDDYDSEFRYGCRPIPALQGLADEAAVIYIGTFSKVLFPALRVGYLVVPPRLAHVFARAKWLADRQTPTLEQRVLTDFITEGHLERHLRRMRTLYDGRRQALAQALATHLADRVTMLGDQVGLHLMVKLRSRLNDEEVVRCAAGVGVGLVGARLYYLGGAPGDEFVLGYGNLSERQIQEGIRRLAKVLS